MYNTNKERRAEWKGRLKDLELQYGWPTMGLHGAYELETNFQTHEPKYVCKNAVVTKYANKKGKYHKDHIKIHKK